MTKNFCDLCHKEISNKGEGMISVGYGYFGDHRLCHKCATPIIKFLQKTKLEEKQPTLKKK